MRKIFTMLTRTIKIISLIMLTLPVTLLAQQVLQPQEAFPVSISYQNNVLQITHEIQKGYYLYKDKISYSTLNDDLELGKVELPNGIEHTDEFFGTKEIYRSGFTHYLPITIKNGSIDTFNIEVNSQGCADIGLCYPPQKWIKTFSGGQYVGEFKDGKRNGQGTFAYADGNQYVGEWKNGKRNGQGTKTYADGTSKTGIWEDDTYIGTAAEVKRRREEEDRKREAEARMRLEAEKKAKKIYIACLLDKSSGKDMSYEPVRIAVEETCEAIALDPSWWQSWKYD